MADASVVVSTGHAVASGGPIEVVTDDSAWYVGAASGTYDILTDRGGVVYFGMELKDDAGVPRNLDHVSLKLEIRRRARDVTPALTLTSDGDGITVVDGVVYFMIGSALTNALDTGNNVYRIVLSEFGTDEVIVEGQFNVDRRNATLQFDASVVVSSGTAAASGGGNLRVTAG